MHQMRWSGTCLAVVLSLGLVACSGSPPRAASEPTSSATVSTAEPAPSSTLMPSATATLAPTPSTTVVPTASALGDLAAFIDAAREVDSRLHAATPLINASIHTDEVVVDAQTAAAVKAVDYSAVASAIPAGMPPELMRQVLTAYSELVSRTRAISHFNTADRTYSRIPSDDAMGQAETDEMLTCLANGSQAAQRFEADLAAVVATAGSMLPLPTVEPRSLAHPELSARLEEIEARNSGCGACGGQVLTRTSSVVWDDAAPSATTRNGTIVYEPGEPGTEYDWGMTFTATYSPGTGWTVDIHAC